MLAQDGSWIAPNVNDAGRTTDGRFLFGTMELVVRNGADAEIAATRLSIAGAGWSGRGELHGKPVVAQDRSGEARRVTKSRRMSISIGDAVDIIEAETLGRCCSFVAGIDLEVLRFEFILAPTERC